MKYTLPLIIAFVLVYVLITRVWPDSLWCGGAVIGLAICVSLDVGRVVGQAEECERRSGP